MTIDQLTLALLVYLVFTEARNYYERKSLYDRLMARDFQDLVTGETERKNKRQSHEASEGFPL